MLLASIHIFLRPLMACCLVAVTVTVHAAGIAAIYKLAVRSWLPGMSGAGAGRFWPITWVVVRFAWLLTLLHMLEILIWALFYWASGSMPDAESAVYFSGVTYSTLGYGDLVLPQRWRLLGPVEGLTGILMCGLSTGFFFALMSHLGIHHSADPAPAAPPPADGAGQAQRSDQPSLTR